MEYGAHLPLIDLDGRGWDAGRLSSYARTAQRLGFATLAANDHLSFRRPWLDGIVSLTSVIDASGDLDLATTVALPVVRGPAALAKAAAALDILSGGRFVLGVGAGSSETDYALAGVDFDERWPRFEEAVRVLRSQLGRDDGPSPHGRFYPDPTPLAPRPKRSGRPPVWVASWGSPAGLRRVARLGDGWLASAYNTTPDQLAHGREVLHASRSDSSDWDPTCVVATMWTQVTHSERERSEWLTRLAGLLGRDEDDLAGRVLIGSSEQCAGLLREYRDAGVDQILVWPLADHELQLELLAQEVIPLAVGGDSATGDGDG
ncbi:LLM class flavin-dependent oxidoreductase [Gordonia hankookensis]|uniref:LLM class flavin-dependent oxidoreductase n=1 Tax=Gordonia hankookensis TaxID=589403 RepID=A0ABR7WEZ6_9ACTN|nr:LLM class flavin-dependent oxidoreductase [Gordonia hankookensis]MBD1321355.1 LLM class flavin-dependent oxidoreductase [Gordonia hankookensis]